MMTQLGIAIAMELIHRYYMPNLHTRVDTWMWASSSPRRFEQMLEQVHYKMYGTTK